MTDYTCILTGRLTGKSMIILILLHHSIPYTIVIVLEGKVGCVPVTTINFTSHTVDLRNQQNVTISCQVADLPFASDITYSLKLIKRGVGELCTVTRIPTGIVSYSISDAWAAEI